MFKTTINGKQIEVTFSHQKSGPYQEVNSVAMLAGGETFTIYPRKRTYVLCPGGTQLTRERCVTDKKTGRLKFIKTPVFAKTHCYFDDVAVGVAWCSMADMHNFDRHRGRVLALKSALAETIIRHGKNDLLPIRDRSRVWKDFFYVAHRKALLNVPRETSTINPLPVNVLPSALVTSDCIPFPSDRDERRALINLDE